MNRDYSIDFLRVIGTFSVIMAHINPPSLLFQLRSFDVILLVILSGMSFGTSNKLTYTQYLFKRCKRLLRPTYICITILFALSYVACFLMNKEQLYTLKDIIYSYILSDHGMGYIWIAKVYLLIALSMPLLVKLDKLFNNDWLSISLIVISLFFQHYFIRLDIVRNNILFSDYLVYIIPYSIVALVGFNCHKKKYKIIIFMLSAFTTVVYVVNNGFIPNSYKFPPDIFYLTYGLSASIVAINLANKFCPLLEAVDKKGICIFLSKNSFTIYLCHIVVMLAYNMIAKVIATSIFDNFIIHYLTVVLFSLCITIFITKFQDEQLHIKTRRCV